jgi:hypothetical protein
MVQAAPEEEDGAARKSSDQHAAMATEPPDVGQQPAADTPPSRAGAPERASPVLAFLITSPRVFHLIFVFNVFYWSTIMFLSVPI